MADGAIDRRGRQPVEHLSAAPASGPGVADACRAMPSSSKKGRGDGQQRVGFGRVDLDGRRVAKHDVVDADLPVAQRGDAPALAVAAQGRAPTAGLPARPRESGRRARRLPAPRPARARAAANGCFLPACRRAAARAARAGLRAWAGEGSAIASRHGGRVAAGEGNQQVARK